MVSRAINQRKAVAAILLCLATGFGIFGVLNLVRILTDESAVQSSAEQGLETENLEGSPEVNTPEIPAVDFQDVVDRFASSVRGNRSVLIYDLDREEEVGIYNADENYNTASLYKLFVVYEGYRRIENGTWDGSMRAGKTGKTILECLDLSIRESNSVCAETLWGMIGQNELDRIVVEDYEVLDSNISTLTSNVRDITAIMRRFYDHPEIKNQELVAKMFDSFLNQPRTTYNWRQGLPSGFSERVKVYNKVGWNYTGEYWSIYHDAAIVSFPEQKRNFIVVVMTNNIHYKNIRDFGTEFEKAFFEQI